MNRKQLKETIDDEKKLLDYSKTELDEAMNKYKKSYEVLVERRDLEIQYTNEFPTMPFDKER